VELLDWRGFPAIAQKSSEPGIARNISKAAWIKASVTYLDSEATGKMK